jgi:hypothetical protein
MSPQPDQDDNRSVLSWESVLDASDTDSTATPPISTEPAATTPSSALTPAPPAPPPEPVAPISDSAGLSAGSDIELSIAPLSLDPLSLDPLPPIPASAAPSTGVGGENADVLGDLHLELPPLELTASPASSASTPPPPAPISTIKIDTTPIGTTEADEPVFDMVDLKIAPLDVPHASLSSEIAAVVADDGAGAQALASAPATVAQSVPAPAPFAQPVPAPASAPADVSQSATVTPRAAVPGLPEDPVAADATPTAVISIPELRPNQVNQASKPAVAAPAVRPDPAPATNTVSRKDRKHDQKLQKHRQKQVLQNAKSSSKQRRSGGGVALFFTLLVLAGLIAGAIIFGKPYLFPDAWDEASRPYGEAVETARGTEIAEPLLVQRRAADVFAVTMADHVVGPWETDMPTWRSLGLVSGTVDAPLLGQLVTDWTPAYYSPATGEVIADDAAPAETLDAAITEAMAAAALDQEAGWSSSIEEPMLDASALTRSAVIASSRASADATSFGVADVSGRDIGVSTFLPPVLEYRVNAPDVYAEFATENAPALDALAASSQLQSSTEPQLGDGEILLLSQRPTDRTFWYLVFASYTDAPTAYAATNALVQASLATADDGGTRCTYATFSGTDVDGTTQVANVLQQWAANAPIEMNAGFSTLPDGSMQLRSCDPGVGFESGARFGVGREIARLRAVELAAITSLPANLEATVDRGAVIDEVRTSATGLPLLDLDFAATPSETAVQARILAAAAPDSVDFGE